jgi:copper(I)-binding protein/mono/diheme cytochrome c family protein
MAAQLGNWLTDWKAPPRGNSYADAPKLRNIPQGEQLYRTRCATCHTITGTELSGALGPDLQGVTKRREPEWLLNWLRAPDQMLAAGDPIATALYDQYNQLAMPNMRLNRQEASDLIAYIADESERALAGRSRTSVKHAHDPGEAPGRLVPGTGPGKGLSVMNAWVREAPPAARMNGGYITLVNAGSEDLVLTRIESDAFEAVEVHEMKTVKGSMRMNELSNLRIPARGEVQMRPGGKHLMLMGPRQHLKAGISIELTLTFGSGLQQKFTVPVTDS